MLVRDILEQARTRGALPFSFEFFPPKTEPGWEKLFKTISELLPLHPAYVSVTYGAGGSTRENTHKLVTRIRRETGIEVVAHLTCEGSTQVEVAQILDDYSEEGITNILALKGDVPKEKWVSKSDFAHAEDLVRFIRKEHPEFGVAAAAFPEGHPATPNRLKEMEYLKAKVDAGVDYLVTQLFFDNRDFEDFVERCELEGIKVPIIAGIMPVSTRSGMERMAELSAGSRFPAKLLRAATRAEDDEALTRIGEHWATEQVLNLMNSNKAAGIHLYTLNSSSATVRICQNLGLKNFS